MRCSFALAAASVLALGLWAGGTRLANAQTAPADVDGSGVHLHASVDHIGVAPPGDRTPSYLMSFSHATQVSGNYSVAVTGAPIISGSAIAGFLLGCGVSTAGGVTVGIEPNQGVTAGVTPSLTINGPSTPSARRIGNDRQSAGPAVTASPAAPTTPAATPSPVLPTTPAATTGPVTPTTPAATSPVTPTTPAAATGPVTPTTPAAATGPAAPTSQAATTGPAPAAVTTSPAATTTAPPATTPPPPTTTTPPTTSSPSGNGTSSSVGIAPNVAGTLGIQEVLTATIGPGQVTTATTATANLDDKTRFPYHLTFSNAAVNVAQCASPVEAVPFVTTTVATPQGSVQTTAYGNKFTF